MGATGRRKGGSRPASSAKQHLQVGGRAVPVSNLEKVLYPSGFTKAQVIDYYIRVSEYLLPHLRDRPVTLKRYPDGIHGEFFYEKDAPAFTPDWVKTFPVERKADGGHIDYILINDLATLVWCANLANLEIHPFLHRVPDIGTPTSIVFDLDPGEGTDVLTCAEVAFLIKQVLDRLKLQSFAKVSGSKGMQLHIPLNTPVTYETTQPFARTMAQFLERERPDLIVSEMAKSARAGKVFIDWSQNAEHKTTVGVYSLRAKHDIPYVSLPVTWDQLERALKKGDAKAVYFEPEAALKRLAKTGDLFAPVLELRQSLPEDFTVQIPAKKTSRKKTATPASLKEYERKRDFSLTSEPPPALPRRSRQGGRRRFVIQKHAASHLHYDFRLEMHDVLKSWAVPKGPPYALNERRLAMATEDHPIDYLDFEGTIPQGEYGGGTVMVWDIGSYELIEGNYYKGKLHIFLDGHKLKGEWVLVKDRSQEKNWYLIKAGEAMKALSTRQDDASALTGRTMARIAADNDRQWQSNRAGESMAAVASAIAAPEAPAPSEPQGRRRKTAATPDLAGLNWDKLPQAGLKFVAPMQPKAVAKLPAGEDWEYEVKLDGYRAIGLKAKGAVTLYSRNETELNSRFPGIASALDGLEDGTMVDGEVVAVDERGRPSFNLLQNNRSSAQAVLYYLFDVIAYRGKSLIAVPLATRRRLLQNAVLPSLVGPVRFSATLRAGPDDLIEATKRQGLEGIVAKRLGSLYEPGRRSDAWAKYRVNKGQELVIGGYKPGRNGFDYLLAGYYEGNKLIFVAKLKNGFVPDTKREVLERMHPLETDACPFANLPEPKNARRGEAITAEVMKRLRWIKPELVAQVEFADWTEANHLRHSKFAGLRDDKDPREVAKEAPAGTEA